MTENVSNNRGMPYIGVTDFVSHEQVLQAVECIPESLNRRLHVGVMMSYKTLHGIPTETGWEGIWPRGDALHAIFQPHMRVFNVLHFADYGQPYLTTSDDLILACQEAGPHLRGLQLDMIWPQAQLIRDVKVELPHLEIILQLGKKALGQMEDSGGYLGIELTRYLDCVDYFLIDWGMGKGVPMDLRIVQGYLYDALRVLTQDRLAVAGGLGPMSYMVLEDIFKKYLNVSCDAQGQMRSTGKATDPIEMERVCGYVRGVCSLV